VLQRVLAIAAHAPELKLEVQGHTDNVGDDDYNLRLSRARAAAVRDWLVANGVAGSRLGVNGYGKARPVASNDDDNGRARNRRVEIARPDCAH
jgi:outer membrane protein OmpA-like peptidoglycan-associated protein